MGSDFIFFIFVLIAIVVGIIVIKKVASCLIKSVFLLLIVGALLFLYLRYFQ